MSCPCKGCHHPLKRHSAIIRKVKVQDAATPGTAGVPWNPGEKWFSRIQQYSAAEDCLCDAEYLVKFGEIDSTGTIELTLVRVYCTGPERHTHVLLPDFLIPYVRHLRTTYEQVLNNQNTEVYLEPSVNDIIYLSHF